MCNSDHRLLSITAAHNWQWLTNTENGSRPFSHESHRWPINKLMVYNHGLQSFTAIYDLDYKTKLGKTKQQQQECNKALGLS